MQSYYISCDRFGDPLDVLRLGRKETRLPGPGQVLVRMMERPVNPSDLIPVRGAYAHRVSLPFVPGYEGVGIVDAVGEGVPSSLIGRRALPLRGEGTWQEYVTTEARWSVLVPDGIDDDNAAQLYINPLTAWLICTDVLALQPDQTLLVNAAGSAIGRVFAQLAGVMGFRVIAITRDGKYAQELLELGASNAVNSSQPSWHEAVMDLTGGRGAHAGIDSIGGPDSAQLAACVRPGGTVLSIGLLSGISPEWHRIARDTGTVPKLFWLRSWLERASVGDWQEAFARIMALVQESRLQFAPVKRRIELKQTIEAVRLSNASGMGGKMMLTSRVAGSRIEQGCSGSMLRRGSTK
ncbi:zinc-dependent alcohol dehydrogenase family protein [Paenibacillus konkukensis]|uniref:zinc-dependent alcohol dehydrogenase family protein n=1 Tax=Paenibacillus konkukensis TaxID=2020716 RepID=UPI00201E6C24|nr:zinc-dependent alcohol dehydrogenase family protein [Paenibacillus konkukensis]